MKKLNLIKSEPKPDPNVIDIQEEDIDMEYFCRTDGDKLADATGDRMSIRAGDEFQNKAIYLFGGYDYAIGEDSMGITILVPLKKKL